jgi:NADH-quinone oxidoreductase subunit H
VCKCILFIYWLLNSLASVIPIILAVAFFTLAERKVMAFLQRRIGPNIVGPFGVLQPIADALKLLFKESLYIKTSTPYMYTAASILPFVFGFINWFNIPNNEVGEISNSSFISLLYVFPISLGGLAGVVLAGWASGSKYSTLGAFRGLSQLISYDIPMIFSILPILFFSGSLDFIDIILNQFNNVWFFFGGLVSFIIFCITVLAETNRVPFDLPEAEAELVAGFNVEYSSINFALFFLGEYSSMLLLSATTVFLFFAGWSSINLYLIVICTLFVALSYYIFEEMSDYLTIFFEWLGDLLSEYFILTEYVKNKLTFLISILITIVSIYTYIPIFLSFFNDYFFIIFDFILGGFFYIPFSYKIVFFGLLFIIVRANVPRYRFDQLLGISWKSLLPISLANTISSFFILLAFNGFNTII